jgi:hypothetical protein
MLEEVHGRFFIKQWNVSDRNSEIWDGRDVLERARDL